MDKAEDQTVINTAAMNEESKEPEASTHDSSAKKTTQAKPTTVKKPRVVKAPEVPLDDTISLKTWTGDDK